MGVAAEKDGRRRDPVADPRAALRVRLVERPSGLLGSTCGLAESLRRNHGDQQGLTCTGDEGKWRRAGSPAAALVGSSDGGRVARISGWGCGGYRGLGGRGRRSNRARSDPRQA